MSGPVDVRKDLNSIASLLEQLRQNNAAIMLDRVSAAVDELIEAANYAYPSGDYSQDAHGYAVRSALDRVGGAK